MRRTLLIVTFTGVLMTQSGCMGRAIREGAGAALGAEGRVLEHSNPGDLSRFEGVQMVTITWAPGVNPEPGVANLIRDEYYERAEKVGLVRGGAPAVNIEGQIIHYESGSIAGQVTGPLSEVIVRVKIEDAISTQILGEANLVGRSKATTSGGRHNLAEGTGRALEKWLEDHERKEIKEE